MYQWKIVGSEIIRNFTNIKWFSNWIKHWHGKLIFLKEMEWRLRCKSILINYTHKWFKHDLQFSLFLINKIVDQCNFFTFISHVPPHTLTTLTCTWSYYMVSVQVSTKIEQLWVMKELSELADIQLRLSILIQGCCTVERTGCKWCTRIVWHSQKSQPQIPINDIRINKFEMFIIDTRHVSVHEIIHENISFIIVETIIMRTCALIKWVQDGFQRCQVKYEPPYNVTAALHTKLSPQGVPSLTRPISGFPDESIVPLVALEVACQQRQCKVY